MERTRIVKRGALYLWQFKKWYPLENTIGFRIMAPRKKATLIKDGGLTITLADYPDFKKRYITLSGVNLARIAGDPSRLSLL